MQKTNIKSHIHTLKISHICLYRFTPVYGDLTESPYISTARRDSTESEAYRFTNQLPHIHHHPQGLWQTCQIFKLISFGDYLDCANLN